MKKRFNSKSGLTLIEIIISLAILSIIMVAFLSLFSNGFITIITMGNKSRASVEAQELVDRIYAEASFTNKTELIQSVTNIINSVDTNNEDYSSKIANFDEPNTNSKKIRFYISDPQAMLIQSNVYTVTVRVYYFNFQRHVTISSPIVR